MVKFVPAWDTRTGEPVNNGTGLVPKKWLDNKVFPHLTGSKPAAKSTPPTPPAGKPQPPKEA